MQWKDQTLNSQKTSHSSPFWVSYGMSVVQICNNTTNLEIQGLACHERNHNIKYNFQYNLFIVVLN